MTPGEWGYQVPVRWRYPNTERERRFIPNEIAIAPGDTYRMSAPQPAYNPNIDALRCPA